MLLDFIDAMHRVKFAILACSECYGSLLVTVSELGNKQPTLVFKNKEFNLKTQI